ncbi:hypothetical protein [Microseira sp. BLCC-F43]|uniref:hypothetical protein n=1 Tax=Microseira sp. BLCC-F43 TaxID=3153602 RepID=UPI0035B8BDF6
MLLRGEILGKNTGVCRGDRFHRGRIEQSDRALRRYAMASIRIFDEKSFDRLDTRLFQEVGYLY